MTYKEIRYVALWNSASLFLVCCFLLVTGPIMLIPAILQAYQFAKLFFAKDLSPPGKDR